MTIDDEAEEDSGRSACEKLSRKLLLNRIKSSGRTRFISYEESLFSSKPFKKSPTIPFTLTLTIMRSKTRTIMKTIEFPFKASCIFPTHAECPWSGRIDLTEAISLSSSSRLQFLIRDGEGITGRLFLVKIDLSGLEVEGETIIRQKQYGPQMAIQQAVQLRVRRRKGPRMVTYVDRDGNETVRMRGTGRDIYEMFSSLRIVFCLTQPSHVEIGQGKDNHLDIVTEQFHHYL